MDKGDFIGREALLRRKAAGFTEKLVAIALEDGYVPGIGEAILQGESQVGVTTTAAFGYSVGKAIALGYVPLSLSAAGTAVDIRDKDGQLHAAEVGPRVMYDPENIHIRS